MATEDGRQHCLRFQVFQLENKLRTLKKNPVKNSPKTKLNKQTNKKINKQKDSYIEQDLEWLQGQDLLFWLNLLQALGIS